MLSDDSIGTLEAGVEYLCAHGKDARLRDWAPGRSILVLADPQAPGPSGIPIWNVAIYVVPGADGTWKVEAPTQSNEVLSFGTLRSACDHVIERLEASA